MRLSIFAAGLLGAVLAFGSAKAAYINIDDSAAGSIHVTAGAFDLSVMINSTVVTGSAGIIDLTVPDSAGPVIFAGNWYDGGTTVAGQWAQVSGDDVLIYSLSTDGFVGGIIGKFCSDGVAGCDTTGMTITTVGEGPNAFGTVTLSGTWQSEIPEPASAMLFGLATIGAAAFKRRRRA